MVINLFGGPGVGKSTISSGVFSLLKLHDVNVEIVSEFAKDLTWGENFKTLENQNYVSAEQHHRQWRLKNKVDVIVTDSPIILSLMYTTDKNDTFTQHIHNIFDEFDNYNYTLSRVKPYKEVGRTQSLEEAIEIDKKIEELLHDKYKTSVVPGDFRGINYISKDVLDRLGLPMKIYFQENATIESRSYGRY